MKRTLVSMALAGTVMLASAAAQALPVVVFTNDFEANTNGFSDSRVSTQNAVDGTNLTQHHGLFTLGQSTTLSLAGLPAHTQLSLAFDLYLFQTWDGENTTYGKDFFSLNGDISFSETFTNHQGAGQSYPGVRDECYGTCTNVNIGSASDTHVYRGLDPTGFGGEFLIAHSASTFTVTFAGPTTQTDEQWSIDNVRVTIDGRSSTVPEPTTLLLLGLGLAGLGFARRRLH